VGRVAPIPPPDRHAASTRLFVSSVQNLMLTSRCQLDCLRYILHPRGLNVVRACGVFIIVHIASWWSRVVCNYLADFPAIVPIK
jgi:hypothetical protein